MSEKTKELNIPDHRTKLILAFVTALSGIGLLFAGMVVPPLGIIDSSLLIAAGEIFVFSGSVLGIKISYDIQLGKLLSKMQNDTDDNEKKKEA